MKFWICFQHEKMVTINADSLEDADEKARAYVERRSEQAQDGSSFKLVSVQPALEEARLEPVADCPTL
jgi:hypothetical protein